MTSFGYFVFYLYPKTYLESNSISFNPDKDLAAQLRHTLIGWAEIYGLLCFQFLLVLIYKYYKYQFPNNAKTMAAKEAVSVVEISERIEFILTLELSSAS